MCVLSAVVISDVQEAFPSSCHALCVYSVCCGPRVHSCHLLWLLLSRALLPLYVLWK